MKDETRDKVERGTAWFFFVFGAVGLVTCFPMWLAGWVDNRSLLGITLALSWLSILAPGFNAIVLKHKEDKSG